MSLKRSDTDLVSVTQPPLLSDVENRYIAWKEDMDIWDSFSTLQYVRKGPALYLSLPKNIQDQARSRVTLEQMKAATGLQFVLATLDELYKKEDVMCLYEAFEKFKKCKRRKEQTISDFINEFELLNNKLVEQDMRIPDKFLGIKLLKSANLPESKEQLMKATATDVGFANMKSKLRSVFCDMVLQSPVKDEPGPEADMIGYTNNYNYRGGYYTSGCRGHLRDRGNDADHSRKDESDNYGAKDTQGAEEGKTPNPPSKCKFCYSIYHWFKDCPKRKNDTFFTQDYDMTFKAEYMYASSLAEETADSMLIDSGAPRSVCGVGWYHRYVDSLVIDSDRSLVKETFSKGKFRFGDSEDFNSKFTSELPIYVGGVKKMVIVDVVDCNIPCLLSTSAVFPSWNVKWDFNSNVLEVDGKEVHLIETTSGHTCLPIGKEDKSVDIQKGSDDEEAKAPDQIEADNIELVMVNELQRDNLELNNTRDLEEDEEPATEEDEDLATEEDEDLATEECEELATEKGEDLATEEAHSGDRTRQKIVIRVSRSRLEESVIEELNQRNVTKEKEEGDIDDIDGDSEMLMSSEASRHEEDSSALRKYSPTCLRECVKMVISLIVAIAWVCKSLDHDVWATFLKVNPVVERYFYIEPPKEFEKVGFIKKGKEHIYGLVDDPRVWYKTLTEFLSETSTAVSQYDKMLFYQNDENCKLRGLIVCHVDDFLYGVTDDFEREVIVKLEKRFKISSKEMLQFNYLGLRIEQTRQNNAIDQNNNVKLLEVVKPTADLVKRDVFTSEDLRELRRAIGQLMWVTSQSRSEEATDTSNSLAEKALTVEMTVLREHCKKGILDVIRLKTKKQIADPSTKAGAPVYRLVSVLASGSLESIM